MLTLYGLVSVCGVSLHSVLDESRPASGRSTYLPGAVTMAVVIQQERTNRWLNLSVVLILFTLIAIDLSTYLKPDTAAAREVHRVAETVEGWLTEQKQGGDGLRFWASNEAVEPLQFHSVRSWKTIHIEPFDHAIVQVDSLTEGGQSVSNVWKIELGIERTGDRVITRIVDAADGSTPPAELASRRESPLSLKSRREREEARKELEELSRKGQELEVENQRKVRELEVENHRKLSRLGESLDRTREETDRRIEEFTRVIALRPADKQSYNERAMAYYHTGPSEAAIADLDRAIGLDPRFDEAYMNRGTVRLVAGDAERAASDFSMVIQLDARKAAAYRLRSVAYDRMGRAQQAASDLNIAQTPSR